MDELRFKTLLEAYGSDVERWPEADRAWGASRISSASQSERALLREEAALDALLRTPAPQEATSALVGRIMAAAPTEPRAAGMLGGVIALVGFGRSAQLAAACLLLVSAGAIAGWTASRDVLGSAAGDALLAVSYGEADSVFSVEDL